MDSFYKATYCVSKLYSEAFDEGSVCQILSCEHARVDGNDTQRLDRNNKTPKVGSLLKALMKSVCKIVAKIVNEDFDKIS